MSCWGFLCSYEDYPIPLFFLKFPSESFVRYVGPPGHIYFLQLVLHCEYQILLLPFGSNSSFASI